MNNQENQSISEDWKSPYEELCQRRLNQAEAAEAQHQLTGFIQLLMNIDRDELPDEGGGENS